MSSRQSYGGGPFDWDPSFRGSSSQPYGGDRPERYPSFYGGSSFRDLPGTEVEPDAQDLLEQDAAPAPPTHEFTPELRLHLARAYHHFAAEYQATGSSYQATGSSCQATGHSYQAAASSYQPCNPAHLIARPRQHSFGMQDPFAKVQEHNNGYPAMARALPVPTTQAQAQLDHPRPQQQPPTVSRSSDSKPKDDTEKPLVQIQAQKQREPSGANSFTFVNYDYQPPRALRRMGGGSFNVEPKGRVQLSMTEQNSQLSRLLNCPNEILKMILQDVFGGQILTRKTLKEGNKRIYLLVPQKSARAAGSASVFTPLWVCRELYHKCKAWPIWMNFIFIPKWKNLRADLNSIRPYQREAITKIILAVDDRFGLELGHPKDADYYADLLSVKKLPSLHTIHVYMFNNDWDTYRINDYDALDQLVDSQLDRIFKAQQPHREFEIEYFNVSMTLPRYMNRW